MDENIMGVNVNPNELSRYARAATAREDEESGTILVNDLKKVLLGRQGENDTQTVVIDASAWLTDLPGCQLTVAALRPGEREVYLPSVTVSNGVITWPILLQDTALAGTGKAEVRAIKDGKIKKSVVFWTRIEPSLEGDGTPNPPTPPEWALEILDAVDEAEEAAASAAASAEATAEAAVNSIRYDVDQSLTDAQKATARGNVGAVAVAQGAENAGKALVVGDDGGVTLGEAGVPSAVAEALLDIFRHVAYVDGDGEEYYEALRDALGIGDFYNQYHWSSDFTDSAKLTRITRSIAFRDATGGRELVSDASTTRRSFVVENGRSGVILDYRTGESLDIYPIPVPDDAAGVTVKITPSSQYLAVYACEQAGELYNRINVSDATWHQGIQTVFFDAGTGTKKYIFVCTKQDSAGSTYTVEPGLDVEFFRAPTDFNNQYYWSNKLTGLPKLDRVDRGMAMETANTPSRIVSAESSTRKSFVVEQGVNQICQYRTLEPLGLYPIPVPDDAVSVTAKVSPATQYLVVYAYEQSGEVYNPINTSASTWHQGEHTLTFAAGSGAKKYITVVTKEDSAGQSYSVSPDLEIWFSKS